MWHYAKYISCFNFRTTIKISCTYEQNPRDNGEIHNGVDKVEKQKKTRKDETANCDEADVIGVGNAVIWKALSHNADEGD